ncbi:MAG: rhomboid family intramembrane serine protease [Acidobacteria bacterium]|nr:rhomboid family intramembrane serine protease [Acidobacteriota bacterium]
MSRMTPGVKWLLIANGVLFVLYFLAARGEAGLYFLPFALVPKAVIGSLALWQLVTYLFLHSPFGFGHILVNMLTLWMFGTALESTWGTRRFLQYYFFCGAGAGVCVVVLNALTGTMNTRTIGASGAIYGLLLAFGILFPRAVIYFFGLFPIEARWYVLIMGAIVFLSAFGDAGSGVSHFAHLGGMLFGYIWLRFGLGSRRRGSRGPGMLESLDTAYKNWKMSRAKKKFQVYLKKHGTGIGYPGDSERDRDKWVH